MSTKRSRVYIPEIFQQRGTGKEIERNKSIVYDFMPVLLSEQFQTNRVLSRQLFRNPPEQGPFMVTEDAYNTLGTRYLTRGKIVPALECYKIALTQGTGFISFIADRQDHALLTQGEINRLNLESPLEKALMKELVSREMSINPQATVTWIEKLRKSYQRMRELNREAYKNSSFNVDLRKKLAKGIGKLDYHLTFPQIRRGISKLRISSRRSSELLDELERKESIKREYIEACLELGVYDQALLHAEELGSRKLVRKIKELTPKEILNVKWLEKYIDDNHPESTMGL